MKAASWRDWLRFAILQMLLQLARFSIVWRNFQGARQLRFGQVGLLLFKINSRKRGAVDRGITLLQRGLQFLDGFSAFVFSAVHFGHSAMRGRILRRGSKSCVESLFSRVEPSRNQFLAASANQRRWRNSRGRHRCAAGWSIARSNLKLQRRGVQFGGYALQFRKR